jgi:hypothetical protein
MGDIKNIGAGEMKKYLIDVTNNKKSRQIVSTEQKFNLYQVKVEKPFITGTADHRN